MIAPVTLPAELLPSELSPDNLKVIPHRLFYQRDAESQLELINPGLPETRAVSPGSHGPARLCGMSLLTSEQEHFLFLKMHWHLFQATEKNHYGAEHVQTHLQQAIELRNLIVQANLRLIISIARTFLRQGWRMDDAFSDACPALIRAVELFDYTRGLCFSTYASHCIRNCLNRAAKKHDRRAEKQAAFSDKVAVAIPDTSSPVHDPAAFLAGQQRIACELLAQLSEREQLVLRARFGLDDGKSKSFDSIGKLMQLSKERVRQITHSALERLQQLVEEQELEYPD